MSFRRTAASYFCVASVALLISYAPPPHRLTAQVDAISYLERLANHLERVAIVPAETEAAVRNAVASRTKIGVPITDPKLRDRQAGAIARIDMAMRDKGLPLRQFARAMPN
jgi:hypothetical protein